MPANKKRYNPLKDSSDIFAEEITSAEKIMDNFSYSQPPTFTEQDFQNLPELAAKIKQASPNNDPKQDEAEILALLDKYFNGDRDTTVENRYKNKDLYKQQLIQKFRRWGLIYVEKKHYSLSYNEKHLIRMDFYGTVDEPSEYQLSEQYKKNKSDLPPVYSRKQKKQLAKQNSLENVDTSVASANNLQQEEFELKDYNLDQSPVWRIIRTFPRFHAIENKVRIQMQRQKLNPDIIPYLNVYDYSDLLYHYFKRDNAKQSGTASIFLGARQSFIKDLFRKHEKWIRDYFKRKGYNERYCEALIKAAKANGVTCDIEMKKTSHEFIIDFVRLHKKQFSNYLRKHTADGSYQQNIIKQLNFSDTPLTEEMTKFALYHEKNLQETLKLKNIISRQTNAIFEALSANRSPYYVKENLRSFILNNQEKYKEFLLKQGLLSNSIDIRCNKIFKRQACNLDEELLIPFARAHSELFREYLMQENRDASYINFAQNILTPPPLPEYITESLSNFIRHQSEHKKEKRALNLQKAIETEGLTPENITKAKEYVLQQRSEYSQYYRRHNILTYQELNDQFTDTTNFIINSQGIPSYGKRLAHDFIVKHKDNFRHWYSNFHISQHQKFAEEQYQHIKANGLQSKDYPAVARFISQRPEAFSDFCRNNQYAVSSEEAAAIFKEKTFNENISSEKAPVFAQDKKLLKLAGKFVVSHGYIYKTSIISQRISDKYKEADLILNKISEQGITNGIYPLAHKFLLKNTQLFDNYQRNNPEDRQYAKNIVYDLSRAVPTVQTSQLIKNFIRRQTASFAGYLNTPENIDAFIAHSLQNLEKNSASAENMYWYNHFISEHKNDFETYLHNEKIGSNNVSKMMNAIQGDTLTDAEAISANSFGNFTLLLDNEEIINIPHIKVHHLEAVQDGFQPVMPDNTNYLSEQRLTSSETFLPHDYPNLAATNYFKNLCAIEEEPYHVQFFHGMDRTEKYNNRERYISRIYPQNPNVIFFGSLDPADQLFYDYANDPRTLRYQNHTENMMTKNDLANQNEPLSTEEVAFIITGSRQGRY